MAHMGTAELRYPWIELVGRVHGPTIQVISILLLSIPDTDFPKVIAASQVDADVEEVIRGLRHAAVALRRLIHRGGLN